MRIYINNIKIVISLSLLQGNNDSKHTACVYISASLAPLEENGFQSPLQEEGAGNDGIEGHGMMRLKLLFLPNESPPLLAKPLLSYATFLSSTPQGRSKDVVGVVKQTLGSYLEKSNDGFVFCGGIFLVTNRSTQKSPFLPVCVLRSYDEAILYILLEKISECY